MRFGSRAFATPTLPFISAGISGLVVARSGVLACWAASAASPAAASSEVKDGTGVNGVRCKRKHRQK
jgi:hypothetical protein